MAVEGQLVGFGAPQQSGIKGGMVSTLLLSNIGYEWLGKRSTFFPGWVK